MTTIKMLALGLFLSFASQAACGGPEAVTDETSGESTAALGVVTDGLPGGGHSCCWRTGNWGTVVNPPNCPAPSVPLTPQNLSSHCACAPIQLWC